MSAHWISAPWNRLGDSRLSESRLGGMTPLVTLCTSTHCQCNESVHRKEQLLFTPFMTVYGDSSGADPAFG